MIQPLDKRVMITPTWRAVAKMKYVMYGLLNDETGPIFQG
jgi:hypothetical protein